ncbi:hypothetical protein LINPERPRIM_LOCUS15188 [Linum perenne]
MASSSAQTPVTPPVFVFNEADVAAPAADFSSSLVARFFFPTPRPARHIQSTLFRIWNLHNSIYVQEVGFDLFQIDFPSKESKDSALFRQPHSIDGFLLSLAPWQTPSTAVFDSLRLVPFWVRLDDMPFEFRTPAFIFGFLSLIGHVSDAGLFDSRHEVGVFLRGLVRVDVFKPIEGRLKAHPGP